MVEKKISVDSQFYGNMSSQNSISGRCVVAAFSVCTILDSCRTDIPGCARHVPCSDSPCSDRPCSDSPCSDAPGSSASLSLSGGKGTLTWTISGLSNPFNTTNYKRVGITSDKFTVGGVSSISGIKASKTAPSSGSSTSVSQTIDYPPGTYTFWGFAHTPSGGSPQYWPAGSDTVTVLPAYTSFQWNYSGVNTSTGTPISGSRKQAGLGQYITAEEWNSLVLNVNQRLGTSISSVKSGSAISAATVNKIASALGVGAVVSGSDMSASFFNKLMDAVNSI